MRAILVALILLAIILVVGLARVCLRRRGPVRLPRVLRRWRPRTPDDCAHYRHRRHGPISAEGAPLA